LEPRGAVLLEHHGNGVVAAATPWRVGRDPINPQYGTWQDETWGYYDTLGEFRYGVMWLAQMLSRCRLTIALAQPGGDEPLHVDPDDPPKDIDPVVADLAYGILMELGGSVGGESQLLDTLTTHISVVGEGYLVGETVGDNVNEWTARSASEIRRHGSRGRIEVIREDSTPDRERWRELPRDSLIVRIWRPHKRYRHVADTPARAARDKMREIELANRKIQAQYLSRLAMAGLIIFPTEVEFPVRPEFADAVNPFVREWIEIASEAIATHGSAASTVPLPIKIPGEYVDKIRHIDFTTKIDEKDLEKREQAIRSLATTLDLPAEVMLGLGDVNHWSAWQLEESGIKVHVSPVAELICYSFTTGYLRPRLRAAGVDPGRLIVWYDTSNLTVRPDRSADAFKAYELLEIDGEALRRETGFTENDRPNDESLKRMILFKLAAQPQVWPMIVKELGLPISDEALESVKPAEPPGDGTPGPDGDGRPPAGDRTAPNTRDVPPSGLMYDEKDNLVTIVGSKDS